MAVRFHLPGLRYNFPINMILLNMKQRFPQYFREGVEIASFFGEFPTSLWNGGRFSGGDQCDARFVKEVIRQYNGQGVPIRYTYTNPNITKEDLKDPYCNFCMEAANNGMNEVIVYSEILEEYIRKNYPKFKINSSTCKEIRTYDDVNNELKKDYKTVVLDFNLNNRFEEYEQITDTKRCEVLVNACCQPNCPRRAEHYRFINKQQRIELENRTLPIEQRKQVPIWRCSYGEKTSLYITKQYETHISPELIWEKYVPMGFENFKIEGRTANIFLLIDTYCYYMMKPEYRDEARMLFLSNLEVNHLVTVNKPRPGVWP